MADTVVTQPSEPVGSAFELVKPSIERVRKNWKAFAVVNALTLLAAVGDGFLPDEVSEEDVQNTVDTGFISQLSGLELAGLIGGGVLIVLVMIGIGFFLQAMMTNLELKAAKDDQPSVGELAKDAKKYFWRLLGLFLVIALIIGVGFILLIVPGIIAIGRLIMAPYHMVDKDLSIGDALRHSNEQAKQYSGKIWGAIGVTLLLSIPVAILDFVPVLGPLLATLLAIAVSLVVALRYVELKRVEVGPAETAVVSSADTSATAL